MEKNIDIDKLNNALRSIILNTLVNSYAVERVAFGFDKIGEQAPIDLYLKHLRLNITSERDIEGIYIDEQERISAGQGYNEFVRDLFVEQMESIFADAPKDIQLERDGVDIPLLPRFRDYLFGLLPLFTEVLNEEIDYNVFDIIPTDNAARAAEYPLWQRFVTSILLKPLRSGSQINRYVKDFNNMPYYIWRLIKKKGKNFYLKPVDINSYEYIFALFSVMKFMNGEHGKLLELKMLEWESKHKGE